MNNLGLLAFFKYGTFVVDNVNALAERLGVPFALADPNVSFLSTAVNSALGWLNLPYQVPTFSYLLPVGISFYVFQSMSYTIDFYRGRIERETQLHSVRDFRVALPATGGRPDRASQQSAAAASHAPRRSTGRTSPTACRCSSWDCSRRSPWPTIWPCTSTPSTQRPPSHHAPALLLATFAFAWQIYFDFSGYTDMARGIGRLLGIRLMLNFNNPYLATGLGDFWQRWHISLSTWFRDYVYIPLGGNRHGEWRTYVNMVLTMLISGLWHGAMWTFILWGGVHAAGRVVTRSLEQTTFYRNRVPMLAKQVLTFSLVMLAWVFFRAQNITDAWLILKRIFTSGWTDPAFPCLLAGLVLSVWLYQYVYESRLHGLLTIAPVRIALVVAMVLYMAVVRHRGQSGIHLLPFLEPSKMQSREKTKRTHHAAVQTPEVRFAANAVRLSVARVVRGRVTDCLRMLG